MTKQSRLGIFDTDERNKRNKNKERNMRILLIDDDKDLCHLTRITLIKHGYEVSVFHDAVSGIKHAQSSKPNLILMDVMLPGVSGAEAVKALKADLQLKNIPVVFLTALVTGEEKSLEEAGLNVAGLNYRTLGKPYEIEKLLEVVRQYAK